MTLYAESSAVLSWLLGDDHGAAVRDLLMSADRVLASELTLVECDRVLCRAAALGELTEAAAAERQHFLALASGRWDLIRLVPAVLERARRPFPGEPIRTLDALHVASALVGRQALPDLKLLALDTRVRKVGAALGLEPVP